MFGTRSGGPHARADVFFFLRSMGARVCALRGAWTAHTDGWMTSTEERSVAGTRGRGVCSVFVGIRGVCCMYGV